jgi:hypothetical protein
VLQAVMSLDMPSCPELFSHHKTFFRTHLFIRLLQLP